MITSANMGQIVSFQVYPSAILPNRYERVKVLSILDPDTASSFKDVRALHNQILPTISSTVAGGVNAKWDSYSYVRILFENGQTDILGLPWIKDETFKIDNRLTVTAVVNNVEVADVETIRRILVKNGFTNISITAA